MSLNRLTHLLLPALGCALFSIASSIVLAAPQMLDRIVAVVDQDVVTQTELDERIESIEARVAGQGVKLPPRDVLQSQVLDQLIGETLQLGLARRYGFQIADQEVLNAISGMMQKNQWTEQDLINNLKAEGKTLHELRESVRRELTLRSVAQGVVPSRIKISEQDIDNFLGSADAQFWASPDYKIGHILIPLSRTASAKESSEAEDKAQQIFQKLKKGANFAEMAIAESGGPAALEGGDLGWRKTTDLPTLFAEVVPKLNEGDVSSPIRSPAGFHILKVYQIRGVEKQEVIETKARHILLKETEIRNGEQAKVELTKIRQSIIDGKDFAKMAKEHSDDIGSKLSGGDLGWARPGMFVPAFEKTMKEAKIGDISEPFKSRFGWHILQVQERRTEDMTEEARRMKARNILMSRRFEDEVQLWLQEMRDEAFIQIKI